MGTKLGSVGGMWVGVNDAQGLGSIGPKIGVSWRDVGWGLQDPKFGVNKAQSLGSMGPKLGVSWRDVGWGQ